MDKILKFITQNTILITIFLLALSLRTIFLSDYPHGFFTDEVVSGYVGRYLILNAHDIHGNFLPLFYFDKFGDFRSIVPMYITGIFTFLFGVNIFAVRVPPAIFGAAIVFPLYYYAMILTKSKRVGLISAFFIAILPWHIILSRAQSEGIMGLTIFLTAMVFAFPSGKLNSRKTIVSGILFALTYLFYPPFRVLAPLVTFGYIFLGNKNAKKNSVILFVILSVLTLIALSTPWGKGRAEQTSLFSSKEIAEKIQAYNENAAIALGPNNILLARVFHNKPIGYIREFTEQYFTFLSPSFLFFNGGLPYRYAVPSEGLIYISFIILFLAWVLIKDENLLSIKRRMFLAYLLLVSILPSALTYEDSPNIHRSLVMTIPLVVIASVGLRNLLLVSGKKMKVSLVFLVFAGITLEFVFFQHQYTQQAPSYKSFLRDDGIREAAIWIKENRENYSKIYATAFGDLAVYYLYETENFDKKLMGSFEKNPIYLKSIGNIEFVRDYCPKKEDGAFTLGPDEVILATGECMPYKNLNEAGDIRRVDSTVAFKIFTAAK